VLEGTGAEVAAAYLNLLTVDATAVVDG